MRELHTRPPLVLPNAWDAGSARAIEAAGATAIATTSAGVSWAAGVEDAAGLNRTTAIAAHHSSTAKRSTVRHAPMNASYRVLSTSLSDRPLRMDRT